MKSLIAQLIHSVLWILLILALAGCTLSGGSPPSANNKNTVTITFAEFDEFRSQYQALIDDFERQNPNISIQFVSIDDAVKGGENLASVADVVLSGSVPQEASNNYLDLTPYLESDPDFKVQAFWPGAIGIYKTMDRTTALPLAVNVSLIFYDGAAFDAAGLARPQPGWTWQDFQAAVANLTQKDGERTTRYGFIDGGSPYNLFKPAFAAALEQENRDAAAQKLANDLDWYASLASRGAIPALDLETGYTRLQELITSGQAAMWMDDLGYLAERRDQANESVMVVPFPVSADDPAAPTGPGYAKAVSISAGTIHSQEAWAWISFLSQRAVPTSSGLIPARIAVAEQTSVWTGLDEAGQTNVRFALEHAWYGSDRNFDLFNDALEQALRGDESLEAALQSAFGQVQLAQMPEETPRTVTIVPPFLPAPSSTAPPLDTGIRLVRYFENEDFQANMAEWQPLIDSFNQAHPDIHIQVSDAQTAFGRNGYAIADLTNKFDCFSSAYGLGAFSAASLYSLTPLLDADPQGEEILGDIPADFLQKSSEDGLFYELPITVQPMVMYYNQDLLSTLGLQPPSPDWTLDDFWSLAIAATTEDTYGFIPVYGRDFLNYLMAAEGIRLYDLNAAPPLIDFDDPAFLNLVSRLADLAERGVVPPIKESIDYNKGNAHERFSMADQGQGAFWMAYAGAEWGQGRSSQDKSFQVGVAPLPAIQGPAQPDYIVGESFYISRQATDPQACWEWIKFLSDHPEVTDGIPVRQSILQSSQYENLVGAGNAAAYRIAILQKGKEEEPEGIYSPYPLYWWWPEALGTVFDGVPASQALGELQGKAQIYLDCVTLATDPSLEQTWVVCAQQADPEFELPGRN
jgi:ABC-type glycerol-3-phosphate transport system substrate-binding protein